jgi:hypothetical protein
VHAEAANVAAWHGSPAWLPNAGTVHTELVVARPDVQPGSWLRPNQYWVPAVVVTTHHSPSLSPFGAPVRRSTRDPSSARGCHRFGPVLSRISSTDRPARLKVALSVAQHSSPVLVVLLPPPAWSSAQSLYRRST